MVARRVWHLGHGIPGWLDRRHCRVRSPNGTTEAGLKVLDAELPNLVQRTVDAAGRRSRELADAARQIDSPGTLH